MDITNVKSRDLLVKPQSLTVRVTMAFEPFAIAECTHAIERDQQ